jgi:hypothetical protein
MRKRTAALITTMLLASCDPTPFSVQNDTDKHLLVTFAFAHVEAGCHTNTFLTGTNEIEPGKFAGFRCGANEIATLTMQQGAKACRMTGNELAKIGHDLAASVCLSQHRVRAAAI